MFPFNYIPESINPKLRKILISLIVIQFLAFVILISILLYEFCSLRRKKGIEGTEKKEGDDKKDKEEKEEKEENKEKNKNKKKKE